MSRASRVETVDDLEGLAPLEECWRALEAADPEAHVFLSWPWIWGRLRGLRPPWQVLVVRSGRVGEIIGLLPLRSLDEGAGWGMAGSPLADLTGLLCAPGFEDEVVEALAAKLSVALSGGSGGTLELVDVHDVRVEQLAERLVGRGWQISRQTGVACPYLELGAELEGDWDRFLATRFSASHRATLRRQLRRVESLPGFRRTSIEEGGAGAVETLLTLWQQRWGTLPPAELAEYRSVFDTCRCEGTLWLDLFWQDERPITGLLAFLDRRRRWFGFYITGFDQHFARLSPGLAIITHSIRWALSQGFETFDFLRGEEPYKRTLGAVPRRGCNLSAVLVQGAYRVSSSSRKTSQEVPESVRAMVS